MRTSFVLTALAAASTFFGVACGQAEDPSGPMMPTIVDPPVNPTPPPPTEDPPVDRCAAVTCNVGKMCAAESGTCIDDPMMPPPAHTLTPEFRAFVSHIPGMWKAMDLIGGNDTGKVELVDDRFVGFPALLDTPIPLRNIDAQGCLTISDQGDEFRGCFNYPDGSRLTGRFHFNGGSPSDERVFTHL